MIPAQQNVEREPHQEHDCPHPGHLGQQIEEARIDACPDAKAVFKVGIGRDLIALAVIGNEPLHRDPSRQRKRKTEDKRIPIS